MFILSLSPGGAGVVYDAALGGLMPYAYEQALNQARNYVPNNTNPVSGLSSGGSGNGTSLGGHVNLKEFGLSLQYPDQANKILENGEKSIEIAQQLFIMPKADDSMDAFRHALWSAMNARDVGTAMARLFAFAHEDAFTSDPDEKLSRTMDLINNEIGYKIGEQKLNSNAMLIGIIFHMTIQGGLIMIENGNLVKTHKYD